MSTTYFCKESHDVFKYAFVTVSRTEVECDALACSTKKAARRGVESSSKTKKPEAEHPASGFFLKTSEIYLIASTIAFNVGLGRIAFVVFSGSE